MKFFKNINFLYYSLVAGLLLFVGLIFLLMYNSKKKVIFPRNGNEVVKYYDGNFLLRYNQIQNLYNQGNYVMGMQKLIELKNLPKLTRRQRYIIYVLEAIFNRARGLYTTALDSLNRAKRYGDGKWLRIMYGIVYEEIGNNPLAKKQYTEAANFEKIYSMGYEKVGDVLFREGKYRKAIDFYFKNNGSQDRYSLIKKAVMHYFLHDYDESLKQLREFGNFSRNEGMFSFVHFFIALNQERLKNYKEVPILYNKSIAGSESANERAMYQYFYGLYLIDRRDDERAFSLFNKISGYNNSFSRRARILMGKQFFRQRSYYKSLNIFKKVYNDRRKDKKFEGDIVLYYAFSTFQAKQYKKTLKLIEETLNNTHDVTDIMMANLLKAMVFLKEKKFDKTIEVLSSFRTRYGDENEFMNLVGYMVLNNFDDRDRQKVFSYIIDNNIRGDYDDILADYFLAQNKYNLALSIYLNKTLKDRGNYIYYKNSGDLYLKVGDIDRALKFYQQALLLLQGKKDSRLIPLYNNMAYIYFKMGQNQEFDKYLSMILDLNSNSPMVFYNFAMTYKYTNPNTYKSYLFRADNIINKNFSFWKNRKEISKIYYELGMNHRKEGKSKMATSFFKRAIVFDSNNNLARLRLRGF